VIHQVVTGLKALMPPLCGPMSSITMVLVFYNHGFYNHGPMSSITMVLRLPDRVTFL